MVLSIVIPARDESPKIRRDVEAAGDFLSATFSSGEVIVVDDGSADDTSGCASAAVVPDGIRLKVIRTAVPAGKGHAVRRGMLASRGDYVMFADAGLTVPFENALRGIRLIKSGRCALAHGSRWLPGSAIQKGQDWDRRIASRAFRRLAALLVELPPGLTDTQCGFKVYDGATARMLYGESIIDGFMFDIEIVVRATLRGKVIEEFPVEWNCDRDSRLHVLRIGGQVLRDLFRIRRMARQARAQS